MFPASDFEVNGFWVFQPAISNASQNNNRWQFFCLLVGGTIRHPICQKQHKRHHQSFFWVKGPSSNPQTNFGWKEGINFYIRKNKGIHEFRLSEVDRKSRFLKPCRSEGSFNNLRPSTWDFGDLLGRLGLFGLATWCGSGPFQVWKELISSVHFELMWCWPCGFQLCLMTFLIRLFLEPQNRL